MVVSQIAHDIPRISIQYPIDSVCPRTLGVYSWDIRSQTIQVYTFSIYMGYPPNSCVQNIIFWNPQYIARRLFSGHVQINTFVLKTCLLSCSLVEHRRQKKKRFFVFVFCECEPVLIIDTFLIMRMRSDSLKN